MVSLQSELYSATLLKLDFTAKWCFRLSAKCSGNSLPNGRLSGMWLALALIAFSVKQPAVLCWACNDVGVPSLGAVLEVIDAAWPV